MFFGNQCLIRSANCKDHIADESSSYTPADATNQSVSNYTVNDLKPNGYTSLEFTAVQGPSTLDIVFLKPFVFQPQAADRIQGEFYTINKALEFAANNTPPMVTGSRQIDEGTEEYISSQL